MNSYWAILILSNCAVWGLVLGIVNWWRYAGLKRKVKKQKKDIALITEGVNAHVYQDMEYNHCAGRILEALEADHQNCRIGKRTPASGDTHGGERKEVKS